MKITFDYDKTVTSFAILCYPDLVNFRLDWMTRPFIVMEIISGNFCVELSELISDTLISQHRPNTVNQLTCEIPHSINFLM